MDKRKALNYFIFSRNDLVERNDTNITRSSNSYQFFPKDADLESDPNNCRPGKNLEMSIQSEVADSQINPESMYNKF